MKKDVYYLGNKEIPKKEYEKLRNLIEIESIEYCRRKK